MDNESADWMSFMTLRAHNNPAKRLSSNSISASPSEKSMMEVKETKKKKKDSNYSQAVK